MEISTRIDPKKRFIAVVFRKIDNIIFGNSVIKRKQLRRRNITAYQSVLISGPSSNDDSLL